MKKFQHYNTQRVFFISKSKFVITYGYSKILNSLLGYTV